MTNEQLDALEAAAKAATPGPWDWNGLSVDADGFDLCSCTDWRSPINRNGTANAAYIAAANPIVVLELIAELRKAKAHITECNRRLADTLELLNIEPVGSIYAKLSYIYHSAKRLQEELQKMRAERDWLAIDVACSARKNRWDESTWTTEYWLERAAKEATCPKN